MDENKLSIREALELGVRNHLQGKLQEAEEIYKDILKKDPDNPDALHLYGLIEHQKGNHKQAADYIKKAIKIKSDEGIYYGNLAMVYDSLGKEEESAENYKKALELNPDYSGAYLAHYNLGIFFKDKGNFLKALEHFDNTIEIKKDFYDAHWNRSLVLLHLGRFKEGWEEYEYRFKKENPVDAREFPWIKWDGSYLNGKKILIVSEQGLGDNIQFIRYLPMIKERGGYIILECRKELRTLFNNIKEIDEFIEKNNDKENINEINPDFYVHLMSLPFIFKTDLNNIPGNTYLRGNYKLSEEAEKKLNTSSLNGLKNLENLKNLKNIKYLKVGIVWSGNPNQDADKKRSARLEDFKALKNISGIKLFSLQKGEASKQLEQLDESEIIDMSRYIEDFQDTANIIDKLDLIISVDTSVAHLAGAMGKPVWVLLSKIPDWRWLNDLEYSPWYPSMKLFRQEEIGDWGSLIEKVKEELKNLVNIFNDSNHSSS